MLREGYKGAGIRRFLEDLHIEVQSQVSGCLGESPVLSNDLPALQRRHFGSWVTQTWLGGGSYTFKRSSNRASFIQRAVFFARGNATECDQLQSDETFIYTLRSFLLPIVLSLAKTSRDSKTANIRTP